MEPKEYRRLHAEWYELFSAQFDHSQEIEFLARSIQEAGQPVLELGCGTGRVLVPLRERGLDIVGLDTSPYMLDRCRTALQAKGLKAVRFAQEAGFVDIKVTNWLTEDPPSDDQTDMTVRCWKPGPTAG